MVSEGMLKWSITPWLRRLLTRSISIVPSIIIAAAVGRSGLNDALTASQVVLSVILPFVTAPLIYFTCRSQIMTAMPGRRLGGARTDSGDVAQTEAESATVNMRNGWIVTIVAVVIWLILVVMNMSLLVLVGLGKA
jgi:metal iron transporter